jgi:hypothetical protein
MGARCRRPMLPRPRRVPGATDAGCEASLSRADSVRSWGLDPRPKEAGDGVRAACCVRIPRTRSPISSEREGSTDLAILADGRRPKAKSARCWIRLGRWGGELAALHPMPLVASRGTLAQVCISDRLQVACSLSC